MTEQEVLNTLNLLQLQIKLDKERLEDMADKILKGWLETPTEYHYITKGCIHFTKNIK